MPPQMMAAKISMASQDTKPIESTPKWLSSLLCSQQQ